MPKYHLIPADFDVFDFKSLKKEIKDNQTLLWYTQSWSKDTKTGEWKDKNYKYNIGDIVYFYYTNIPDLSSRILLRGEVFEINKEETWIFDGEVRKCKWMSIGNISPIELSNVDKYSFKNLKDKYNIGRISRRELKGKIVEDLEKDNDKNRNVQDVVDYFNKPMCECCEILNKSTSEWRKRTFIKTNGIIYREIHHLLMQNIKRKTENWYKEHKYFNEEDKKRVDYMCNTISLCPVCHREFHYGNFGDNTNRTKKKIIEELMKKKNFINELKNNWKKNDKEVEEIKKYILQQYDIFE